MKALLVWSIPVAMSVMTAPAVAQMDKALKPQSAAQVEAVAKACVGTTASIDQAEKALIAGGWSKGNNPAIPMRFFSRDGVVLLLNPEAGSQRATCLEMIKLDKPTPSDAIGATLDRAFGVKAVHGSSGQTAWIFGDEIAGFAGDSATPTSIRLVVAPNQGEGKK